LTTGVAAGVIGTVEANGALPIGALVAGETGVVGFMLADDGNVEGIA
jgi:hypothetical protein